MIIIDLNQSPMLANSLQKTWKKSKKVKKFSKKLLMKFSSNFGKKKEEIKDSHSKAILTSSKFNYLIIVINVLIAIIETNKY